MFYTQSGVHILYLVRILYPVRSPWSAVRSPCFILTGFSGLFQYSVKCSVVPYCIECTYWRSQNSNRIGRMLLDKSVDSKSLLCKTRTPWTHSILLIVKERWMPKQIAIIDLRGFGVCVGRFNEFLWRELAKLQFSQWIACHARAGALCSYFYGISLMESCTLNALYS